MNKFFIALLLSTLASVHASASLPTPHYTCDEKDYVEYEVEALAIDADDVQFDRYTHNQIFNEYFYMLGQRTLLRKQCSKVLSKFDLAGVTYMVVQESNSTY